MVSNHSYCVSESTSDDETGDMEYSPKNQHEKPTRKPTRTPKCFSKNALMARENRLKKKMYLTTLENQVAALKVENKKLQHCTDKQADTIVELKKEIKYLKSILANSEGLGKLVKAIHTSTGMSVTTSLNKKIDKDSSVNKSPKDDLPVDTKKQNGRKPSFSSNFDLSRHPWEDTELNTPYANYPTPESTNSYYGSPEFEELDNEGLLLDMDIPINMDNNALLDMIDEKALEAPLMPMDPVIVKSEPKTTIKEEDDVGVCLHVSRNKVSLEFCPSCSDSASLCWEGNKNKV